MRDGYRAQVPSGPRARSSSALAIPARAKALSLAGPGVRMDETGAGVEAGMG